jgi:very-short-patch-repair endonuclease
VSEKLRTAKVFFGQHRRKRSPLEEQVAAWIGRSGLPQPMREFRFAPPRLYRFDFCWVATGIALEVEGAIWARGRHTTGAGFADDADKYNLATLAGWRVFRITDRQIRDGSAFELIQRMLTTEILYRPSLLAEAQ